MLVRFLLPVRTGGWGVGRSRLVAEPRKARLTGIDPGEGARRGLSMGSWRGCPRGCRSSGDRIEVRFGSEKDAVGRLYALAQALVNDYERFEELVDGGGDVVGEGEVSE